MKEPNAAHGYTEGSEVPTEQEIKAYLNYEDVQKELETANGLIKELMPLAKAGAMYYRQNPGFDWVSERDKSNSIIQRANEFLK